MNLMRSLLAAPLLCLLAACSSAAGPSNGSADAAPVTTNGTIVSSVTDPSAFKVGTNVSPITAGEGSRPFMNLIYGGGGFLMQNTVTWTGSEEIPSTSLDANGWVKSVPAGYQVLRGMSVPLAGGDFICRYQGNGTLNVTGPVSNVTTGAGVTRFTIAATYPNAKFVVLTYNVDPTNYIRNIDCRETSASTTAIMAPEFLAGANGFKVIRFMKWQPATEANTKVTWATRNKPGDGDYSKSDGVPVEVMVEAANQLGSDAWFSMPWNADDDYITRFATYVRDNLAPGHQVYVEASNEVWNGFYPVYGQAQQEAVAEGLPRADGNAGSGGALERYAEKTQQMMQIWSNVFAGQTNRLVRVAAFQHVQPFWSDKYLAYRNLYQSVDALATGPYFGYDVTDGQTVDQIMASLPAKVTDTLNLGVQQKAVAQKYGLRYVTYEAGQHITLPNNIPLLQQVERDPRMYDVYKSFIGGWQSQIGDTLTLFVLNHPIWQFGGFGLSEYIGQPLAETPKRRAVQDFLGIATASVDPATTITTTTTTTQVCPDGTVILSTSTCPTTSTTTTTTTTTSPTSGKRKAYGSGGSKAV